MQEDMLDLQCREFTDINAEKSERKNVVSALTTFLHTNLQRKKVVTKFWPSKKIVQCFSFNQLVI